MTNIDRMKRLFGVDWKPKPEPSTVSNITVLEDHGTHLVVKLNTTGMAGLFSDRKVDGAFE